jgi:polyisoprenoid-binding protein YceI
MEHEVIDLVRTVDGRDVPAAGVWNIDPTHTQAEFVARHLMVSKVRGGFTGISGTIDVAEDPLDSRVEVVLDAATVTTGTADRDAHLTSPDFLDVETHPEIRFVSTSVAEKGSRWMLDGELTIRDVTRPVALSFEFIGITRDPWGNAKAAFSATTEIQREDWGLTWNVALEGGNFLVSKTVTLEIEVQAVYAG